MAIDTERNLHLGVEIRKKLKGFELEMNFQAKRGCMGILGPSGCGKSMTLKSIAGIVTPDAGRIALQYAQGEAAGGRVLFDSSLRINECPQARRVGYLFQNYALFPNMSVEENIVAGLKGKWARKAVGGRRPATLSGEAIKRRPSCPAASSSGQPWPGLWPMSRRWCSLTSHFPLWTRICGKSCAWSFWRC